MNIVIRPPLPEILDPPLGLATVYLCIAVYQYLLCLFFDVSLISGKSIQLRGRRLGVLENIMQHLLINVYNASVINVIEFTYSKGTVSYVSTSNSKISTTGL